MSIVMIRTPEPGLSPRVRGNRAHNDDRHNLVRSIPACAGEPRVCNTGWGRNRVYPRVCGGTPR